MGEVEDAIKKVSSYYQKRAKLKEAKLIESVAEGEHKLIYDSATEQLEPVYFFLLDLMGTVGLKDIEKLVDNFTSSPGSGHFSELQTKSFQQQQQGQNMLAQVNAILRSVLNLVYDLKEFRMRLQSYDDLKSKDKDKTEAARLSLKQIWLDKVDMMKGNSSISMMARQIGFQTLFDAFYVAKDEKNVDKIDLNDRVKRLVKQRIHEFNIWIIESEKELRKRYEMERNYLKSQVSSLKLYSRWAKPYLKAAQQLEMKEGGKEPALVKAFNTIVLELVLFGKADVGVPEFMGKFKPKRKYYKCAVIEFKFRGIPQKVAQQAHYAFGGRTEVLFKGYALNEDELEKFQEELGKSDVEDVLGLIEGATTESLGQLQEEIDFFLEDKEKDKEKEKPDDTSNPFLAIFGVYDKKDTLKGTSKKNNKKKIDKVKPDDWMEKTNLRTHAQKEAKQQAFDLFNIYKKAHGMPNYDYP